MPSRIAAVTLDLWETLIQDSSQVGLPRSASRITRITRILGGMGFRFTESDLNRAYEESNTQYERVWALDRELDTHEQIALMLDSLESGLSDSIGSDAWKDISAAYVDPIFDHPPAPAPHALESLDALRAEGYRLGLICNTGRTPGYAMRELLERYGIWSRLDTAAFSNEEGLRKPRREIFDRVLERLDAKAERTVHVGDNPRDDIMGARQAGMRAIYIGAKRDVVADATIGNLGELPEAVRLLG